MKLILLNRDAASRTIELGRWSLALLSACIIGVPLSLVAGSYQLGFGEGIASEQATRISTQEQQAIDRAVALAEMGVEAQSRLTAMTRRLASLQAHVTRLDALGSHLTDLAGLEAEEFDFSGPPALGGPALMLPVGAPPGVREVDKQFTALDALFVRREAQFDVLAGLLSAEQLRAEATPAGRPIRSGWQSSAYGARIDPITGERAWHEGALVLPLALAVLALAVAAFAQGGRYGFRHRSRDLLRLWLGLRLLGIGMPQPDQSLRERFAIQQAGEWIVLHQMA